MAPDEKISQGLERTTEIEYFMKSKYKIKILFNNSTEAEKVFSTREEVDNSFLHYLGDNAVARINVYRVQWSNLIGTTVDEIVKYDK